VPGLPTVELPRTGGRPLQADGDIVATLPVYIAISQTPQAFVCPPGHLPI